jgi:hypothetical protein
LDVLTDDKNDTGPGNNKTEQSDKQEIAGKGNITSPANIIRTKKEKEDSNVQVNNTFENITTNSSQVIEKETNKVKNGT